MAEAKGVPAQSVPETDAMEKPDSTGWSADNYNKTAAFVYSPVFTAPVLELLSAKPGERILDVGCGSGELTLLLQQVVEQKAGGVVVGTDFSESMIKKARSNGVKHMFIADAQELEIPKGDDPEFSKEFDAIFSNAALHWCKRDPLGVLTSVRKVLKPGGRIAAEMGGFMNVIGPEVATQRKQTLGYFPSMEDYVQLLIRAGFEPTHMSLVPRITPLATDLYDWMNLFVRNSFLRDFSDEKASEIMREVQDRCQVDCRDGSGKWAIMYTRLRFSAILKS